ncbi:MAG: hypothetical protein A3H91_08010 [Gammaproteobacteria bacterium RIFCSPLOWO2_02_FULL_61_13]|nr:MAG: hypothetical protein A3H91_08010 [Gammaproteobacteria bacterium RIFCSPLOWO2_02_FULL_61_13]
MPHRIDVHHHIVPPRWLAEEGERMFATAVNFDHVAKWTPEMSLESMDRNGVATAITSVSTVIVRPDDPAAASSLVRYCNEWAVKLAQDHPGRFGTFGLLPLPHIAESLKEIEYCADVLKVEGFKLQTSYKDKWPGDPAFAPVFDELNRRKAVIFFHPTAPDCCLKMIPGLHPPLMEYPFDTTRAIASLLFSGTFSRCPDISFIFTHGGGTLPMLAHRIVSLSQKNPELRAKLGGDALGQLQKLNFDIVSVTNKPAMSGLLALATASRCLFGTDTPYLTIDETIAELSWLGIGAADLKLIERDNALALMPTLARR